MKENWYALCAAICCPQYLSPEQAIRIIRGEKGGKKGLKPQMPDKYQGKRKRHFCNMSITDGDIQGMIQMRKEGMVYKEIGKVYGMSMDAVFKRIAKYKKERLQSAN